VAFIVDETQAGPVADLLQQRLNELRKRNIRSLIWGAAPALGLRQDEFVELLSAGASVDEFVGRVAAGARYAAIIQNLERELNQVQRLGRQIDRHFTEIDKEMRMAGRLQRHFLPRAYPFADALRFAHLYRPATWVSGDIFDAFEIDERTAGMFIADAMGHGTSAALMTMFLRKALTPRRSVGAVGAATPPADALLGLHDAVVEQRLPNSNFVTSAYVVIDVPTLQLRMARGGHPYPLLIRGDGEIVELTSEGGLLGLAEAPPEISEQGAQLQSGDKLLLYTDGFEDLMIQRDRHAGYTRFRGPLREAACEDVATFIEHIAAILDRSEGSLNPEDDITIVGMQVP
jgi:sigma-B regulation protein RsbU (phosphoserine phosphatase)